MQAAFLLHQLILRIAPSPNGHDALFWMLSVFWDRLTGQTRDAAAARRRRATSLLWQIFPDEREFEFTDPNCDVRPNDADEQRRAALFYETVVSTLLFGAAYRADGAIRRMPTDTRPFFEANMRRGGVIGGLGYVFAVAALAGCDGAGDDAGAPCTFGRADVMRGMLAGDAIRQMRFKCRDGWAIRDALGRIAATVCLAPPAGCVCRLEWTTMGLQGHFANAPYVDPLTRDENRGRAFVIAADPSRRCVAVAAPVVVPLNRGATAFAGTDTVDGVRLTASATSRASASAQGPTEFRLGALVDVGGRELASLVVGLAWGTAKTARARTDASMWMMQPSEFVLPSAIGGESEFYVTRWAERLQTGEDAVGDRDMVKWTEEGVEGGNSLQMVIFAFCEFEGL